MEYILKPLQMCIYAVHLHICTEVLVEFEVKTCTKKHHDTN